MIANLPSNTQRAVRNREYSRRHRAKCNGERNELKVPMFHYQNQTSILTFIQGVKGGSFAKVLQSMYRITQKCY